MDYINLINKKLTDDITDEQLNKLQHWLDQDLENKKTYREITELCELAPSPQLKRQTPMKQNWEKIDQSIDAGNERKVSRIENAIKNIFQRFSLRPGYVIVAVACSLIIVAAINVRNFYNQHRLFEHIQTSNQQIQDITLPDGSTIKLNSGSSITYLKSFLDSTRLVTLKGEAFFNIQKDMKPFIVVSENARTTVLGTRFNVWARNNETRVIVKEGVVELIPVTLDTLGSVELHAGQMSRAKGDDSAAFPKNVNADYLLGWLHGTLVFEKTPISEIVDELQRTFGIKIVLSQSIHAEKTLTADFDSASIDDILTFLCASLEANYSLKNGKYLITKE